ncbi:MAG: hypothetical protein HEQ39_15045 [Rhizobacter sp.]
MRSNPMQAMSPHTIAHAGTGALHPSNLDAGYPPFPLEPPLGPMGLPHHHHRQDDISATPSSTGFTAMLQAYRATGGTARGDDLARLLQDRPNGGYVSLARLIATRKVFSFEWRNTYWVPMFQFDLSDLSLRPGPQQVMGELNTEFDDWSLAVWFTQPNAWLHGDKPVDVLGTDLKAVIDAARADRFVAAG